MQFTINLQTKMSDIYTPFRVQNIHLKVNNDIIEISSTVKPVFRGHPSKNCDQGEKFQDLIKLLNLVPLNPLTPRSD